MNTSTISTMRATSTSGNGASAVSTASGGGTVFSGFGGAAATSTASAGGSTSDATAMLLSLGHSYGIGIVVAGVLVGFGLL